MESETLTAKATITTTTLPSHDETKTESTEFEKNQKRYQDLISTFPHEKGWRPKEPLIEYGGYWWLPSLLEGCIHAQEFFQARPSDFLVCSYPKTGTTWLKALTFAIANRSRFDDSSNPLLKRNPHEFVPYIEIDFPFFPEVDVLKDKGNTLFSTHIPYELLSDSVVKSGCKMVYIWREPKDTFISMWTFLHKERTELGPVSNLEESFDMFCRGLSGYGPYLNHILAYWKAYQENPDRILFLKYETMRADPLPYVKSLAEFMGHGFTAEEEEKGVVEKVVNLCSFETLKNLEANKGEKGREDRPGVYANSAYFRKGKVGDWSNYLTPEMAARIDGLMEEKFKGTGLLEHGK
ncbi:Cytosolic sulfotransferase 18 [Arabidopsis thaliana]|uniref:Sulfotransferase n=3 Tax=Arabidopsis TaxID=3701 RepID=A0A178WNK0_ARATH|nr:desulfoglucosinolate sulfotransferase [Arabidopsis thaliana]KAG7651644.1 P-loop containing nucleoside triphosphate hydrolase [Arabidopsis thaliana x Arabidopsis arenosa]OAP19786.1 SOT18 [Arabidopsis thaliana]